jgi:uncharacterized protein (DUF2132 family)
MNDTPRQSPAPKDPLHGITLETILKALVQRHGWAAMGRCVDIRCFTKDPSIKSSLVFLRRNLWARALVERMYVTGDLRPGAVRAAIARKKGKARGLQKRGMPAGNAAGKA